MNKAMLLALVVILLFVAFVALVINTYNTNPALADSLALLGAVSGIIILLVDMAVSNEVRKRRIYHRKNWGAK